MRKHYQRVPQRIKDRIRETKRRNREALKQLELVRGSGRCVHCNEMTKHVVKTLNGPTFICERCEEARR